MCVLLGCLLCIACRCAALPHIHHNCVVFDCVMLLLLAHTHKHTGGPPGMQLPPGLPSRPLHAGAAAAGIGVGVADGGAGGAMGLLPGMMAGGGGMGGGRGGSSSRGPGGGGGGRGRGRGEFLLARGCEGRSWGSQKGLFNIRRSAVQCGTASCQPCV